MSVYPFHPSKNIPMRDEYGNIDPHPYCVSLQSILDELSSHGIPPSEYHNINIIGDVIHRSDISFLSVNYTKPKTTAEIDAEEKSIFFT